MLPELAFPERRVFPVVAIDEVAAEKRGAAGPCLDRTLLSLWESWPVGLGHGPPPQVLRIVGFVAVGPVGRAVPAVARLRGYGAGACVSIGRARGLDAVPAYLSLLRDGANGLEVLRVGLTGPVATAARTVAVRAREETLYAWAARHGAVQAARERGGARG
jgi:hypothetical protein